MFDVKDAVNETVKWIQIDSPIESGAVKQSIYELFDVVDDVREEETATILKNVKNN